MLKTHRQLREEISRLLLRGNSQMPLSWLKRLNKRELQALWMALTKDDEEDLIRF